MVLLASLTLLTYGRVCRWHSAVVYSLTRPVHTMYAMQRSLNHMAAARSSHPKPSTVAAVVLSIPTPSLIRIYIVPVNKLNSSRKIIWSTHKQ